MLKNTLFDPAASAELEAESLSEFEAYRLEKARDAWRALLLPNANRPGGRWVANMFTVFENEPLFADAFALNILSDEVEALRAIPEAGIEPGPIKIEDETKLKRWLNDVARFPPTDAVFAAGLHAIAAQNAYHPVQNWLADLPIWDGEDRISGLLTKYFKAEDEVAYLEMAARVLILSATQRALKPGCKNDHMLILEGAQGIGKSSAVRALGGAWFGDQLADLTNREGPISLRGKWIMEVAELDAMNKAEASAMKEFLSRNEDTFRPLHAGRTIDVPRALIFVGTTNETQYLKDPTGARRFLPIKCGGDIDTAGLARIRPQLFAQAKAWLAEEQPWWVTKQDSTLQRQATDTRQQTDPSTETLGDYVRDKTEVTTRDLLKHLDIEPGRQAVHHSTRVGVIMRAIGWQGKPGRREENQTQIWTSGLL